MVSFTLPTIDEKQSVTEQLRQIRGYIMSLTEQVRWLVNAMDETIERNTDTATNNGEQVTALQSEIGQTADSLRRAVKLIPTQSGEPPVNQAAGATWLDLSGEYPVYRRYDGANWVPVTDYRRQLDAERMIHILEDETGANRLARKIRYDGAVIDAVNDTVIDQIMSGEYGYGTRLSAVEEITDRIAATVHRDTFQGENGLRIGDRHSTWLFVGEETLKIIHMETVNAEYRLRDVNANNIRTRKGISFGEQGTGLRVSWDTNDGLTIKPE